MKRCAEKSNGKEEKTEKSFAECNEFDPDKYFKFSRAREAFLVQFISLVEIHRQKGLNMRTHIRNHIICHVN